MKNKARDIISVFEHESLYVTRKSGVKGLTADILAKLQDFYGKGSKYYSLIHNGVRFCEYVGILQIGDTIIEVLPKADKSNDEESWRSMLIKILTAVGFFDVYAPSNTDLKLKHNSILDLYFEIFINEVERLLKRGLVKKYRRTEGNLSSLKGSLHFSRQVRENYIHQERFYARYTAYDFHHPLNLVLYKTIKLLERISTNSKLNSRIGNLLLNFQEMPDILVNEAFFEKLLYNRTTEQYKKAVNISKMLLLNYHPDVIRGKNNALALMFDMNLLWERFVYNSLQKHKAREVNIGYQPPKDFWQPKTGRKRIIRPDIVITNIATKTTTVLDTKWKRPDGFSPSPEDLRQLYTYSQFHDAVSSALLYPGERTYYEEGFFFDEAGMKSKTLGGILIVKSEMDIKEWQKNIADLVFQNLK